jgi:hypothetical protein
LGRRTALEIEQMKEAHQNVEITITLRYNDQPSDEPLQPTMERVKQDLQSMLDKDRLSYTMIRRNT